MSELALKHLAIIMDGNGRWAKSRRHSRTYGHVRGAQRAKEVIEACAQRNIDFLTLFAFSTENWLRPLEEVNFLMSLLVRQLKKELPTLQKNNIRFQVIGDLNSLPSKVQQAVTETIEKTKNNTGMTLVFALSYGGRQEIVEGCKLILQRLQEGTLTIDQLDESKFASCLSSAFLPDPDLVVRTSGETRISNFLLWQCAYSEFLFMDKYWPDFTTSDLDQAIEFFKTRMRRFGKTQEQINELSVTLSPS